MIENTSIGRSSDIWRTLTVNEVENTESSINFKTVESQVCFAISRLSADGYGITKIEVGDKIQLRGITGNSDADLSGMNVIADIKLIKKS